MPNLNPQTLIAAIESSDLNKVNLLLRRMQPSWWQLGSTDRFKNYVTANDNAALRRAIDIFGDRQGDTAVKLAIVNRLLEIPYIRDHAAAHHNEAFHKAVEFNQPEVVRKLLQIEAVKAKATGYENTALHLAAQQNFPNVINELLQITEIVDIEIAHDFEFPRALELAIKSRSRLQSLPHTDAEDTAIILLQNPRFRANAATEDNKALLLAARHGDLRLVNELLSIPEVMELNTTRENGVNIIFMEAVKSGSVEVIQALVPYIQQHGNELDVFYQAVVIALAHRQRHVTDFILRDPEIAAHVRDMTIEKIQREPNNLNPMDRALAERFNIPVNADLRQIDTHTVSVHKSASESAERLLAKYKIADFTPAMSNLTDLFTNHMSKLIASIAAIKNEDPSTLDADQIKLNITTAVDYILRNDFIINGQPFKDPTTSITLDNLLKSILVAINSLDNTTPVKDGETTLREDAYIQLCSSIYLLQNEYALNSPSCPAGFFNAMIYSQQTTLPDEVRIEIQNKDLATTALKSKIRNFAREVFNKDTFSNGEDFEAKVVDIAAEKQTGKHIMQELMDEFHLVFKFDSAAVARQASDDAIDAKSVEVFGCTPAQIFSDIGFDYKALFDELKQPAASSSARPRSGP